MFFDFKLFIQQVNLGGYTVRYIYRFWIDIPVSISAVIELLYKQNTIQEEQTEKRPRKQA